jgi:1-acyl-sn-glycerol-3-phosphate acyltransferase
MKGIVRFFIKRPEIYCDENLNNIHSSIFVSNHVGFFAPFIINLYVDMKFIPWVIHDITDKKLCRKYINSDFTEPQLKLKPPLSYIVSSIIDPICISIMDYLNAIPVYKGSQKISETILLTLDRLKEGHNILIFPEDRNKKYNDVIDKFNTGFINVAKMYYKEYGGLISFYPVCVNKSQNRIFIGKKIVYDPNISYKSEKERIANYLMESISKMYYCSGF